MLMLFARRSYSDGSPPTVSVPSQSWGLGLEPFGATSVGLLSPTRWSDGDQGCQPKAFLKYTELSERLSSRQQELVHD